MQRIGKYEIISELGQGGMGTVYKAYDTIIDREVAVKIIQEQAIKNPIVKKRFYREARSAGRLTHENITVIHDIDEENGIPYLVMEYLDGTDLRDLLQIEPLSQEEKIQIAIQVCRGLKYAHDHGVIHRDIKPSNIRILRDGRVKIIDFGVARIQSEGGESLTMTNAAIGTPRYMAPEQILGEEVDKRVDIFSLGVVLYEMLTSLSPFGAQRLTTVMYKIVHTEPPPMGIAQNKMAKALQPVVMKCLAKDREHRYQDIGDVLDALEDILEGEGDTRTMPVLAPEDEEEEKKGWMKWSLPWGHDDEEEQAETVEHVFSQPREEEVDEAISQAFDETVVLGADEPLPEVHDDDIAQPFEMEVDPLRRYSGAIPIYNPPIEPEEPPVEPEEPPIEPEEPPFEPVEPPEPPPKGFNKVWLGALGVVVVVLAVGGYALFGPSGTTEEDPAPIIVTDSDTPTPLADSTSQASSDDSPLANEEDRLIAEQELEAMNEVRQRVEGRQREPGVRTTFEQAEDARTEGERLFNEADYAAAVASFRTAQDGFAEVERLLAALDDQARREEQQRQQEQQQPVGTLAIDSSPRGARIFVDGRDRGTTPRQISDVVAGRHSLELRLDGHASYSESISVRAEQTLQVNPTLTPLMGTLKVSAIPWGRLLIDGELRSGELSSQETLEVRPGRHTIRVEHPEFGTWEQQVDVSGGLTRTISVDFLKQVQVRVTSVNPDDNNAFVPAVLLVDGRLAGEIPAAIDLRVGQHTFELRAAGYVMDDSQRVINITEDLNRPIQITLRKQEP